jgi:hypothetical protein
MCLNEAYSTAYSKCHIGKSLSDNIPIQNGLNQGRVFWHLFSTSLNLEYTTMKVHENQFRAQIKWDTSAPG